MVSVSAVYDWHGGNSFSGHHGYVFDDARVAHLPKLSGGFGFRPSAGLRLEQLLPMLNVSAALEFQWSHHSAEGYNAGNVPYDRDGATLVGAALPLRASLALGRLQPFVQLAPGHQWLKLPNGVTIIEPATRNVSWQDLTLRGLSVEADIGASYSFTRDFDIMASAGYRAISYSQSSLGAVSGIASQGVVTQLGGAVRF